MIRSVKRQRVQQQRLPLLPRERNEIAPPQARQRTVENGPLQSPGNVIASVSMTATATVSATVTETEIETAMMVEMESVGGPEAPASEVFMLPAAVPDLPNHTLGPTSAGQFPLAGDIDTALHHHH